MNFNQLLAQKNRRWNRAIILLTLTLSIVSVFYLMLGEIFITPSNLFGPLEQQLLMELRLPRLLAAMMIGAALAASGATLQVLLGNVLAEPGVLGISGGASLGMVIILFFLPQFASPHVFIVSAMAGSLLFTLLLVTIAHAMRLSTARLLLVGVGLGILSGAVVTWAFYFSDDLSLRILMYWLMGSLGGADWPQHVVSLIMLPVLAWLLIQGRVLDTLMLGENHATQLGLNVPSIRWKLIIAISVLVGGSVALGGVIGFVGLVVPHLIRLCLGTENEKLVPLSAVCGALLLVIADILARVSLDSAELPVGVVTTTIGAPIFIWMLLKNHDSR
ncbi:vitamin B12 ABC transporter permease BtuC [Vibrio maerlii]|uniref:vitamin B12 ABC transporter permease BtuC n=1 Tax=Vibrio maerlii TaxID=2231648 RepID=UPI000E3C01B0|nr:vitamin B12 ABC transporter permease BtuC [Vibrio maerlii]